MRKAATKMGGTGLVPASKVAATLTAAAVKPTSGVPAGKVSTNQWATMEGASEVASASGELADVVVTTAKASAVASTIVGAKGAEAAIPRISLR